MAIFSGSIRWRWIAVLSLLDGIIVMGSSAGFGLVIGWGIALMLSTIIISSIPISLYKVFKGREMQGIPSFVWTLQALFLTLQQFSYYS